VPRATTMVNIVQRVGGSLGTALFAVVLERHITAGVPGAGGGLDSTTGSVVGTPVADVLAAAFGSTFWWVVGSTVLAVVPAIFLPRRGAAAVASPGPSTDAEVDVTAADDLTAGLPLAGAADRR
jgi:hypothetical protein